MSTPWGLSLPLGVVLHPPLGMRTYAADEAAFTLVCAVPLIVSVVLAIRLWRRERNSIALFCLFGGAIACVVEPLLDSNGGVWWPAGGWDAFTMAGETIPLLVIMVYPWLLGGQGFLAWRAFDRGADARSIWRLFGLFLLVDVVLETIGIGMHTYAYFGNQSLDFWGLPLWYTPLNAGGPLIAGAIFYLLAPHFTGIRRMLLLLVFPMSFALFYAGAGFPMWLSLQSTWPRWLSDGAGLMTLLLAYMLVSVTLIATGTPGVGRQSLFHDQFMPLRRYSSDSGSNNP